MRMKTTFLVIVFILGLGGCSSDTKQQSQKMEMPPLPVGTYTVKSGEVVVEKSYPAIVKPFEEVDIIARVSGILEKKYFTEGAAVKKGDLLYKIEQDSYMANLNVAKAVLQKARAAYQKASRDWERAEALFKTKTLSDQERDTYLSAYESAKAEVQNAKAVLMQAQIEYGYTIIKSPINGIAGIKVQDIGDYVGSNDDNALLTTITRTDPIHVEFSISKSDAVNFLNDIKNPDLNLTMSDNKGKSENGTIDYISPKIDTDTDTLLLRAKFENNASAYIVGEFVKVHLNHLKLPGAFTIPEQAILQTPGGSMVYVIEEGTAKIRPVDAGILTKQGVVINGGLKEGEQVIVSNIAKVRPNAKVQIMGGK